jgi:hypothetical protein
VISIEPLPSPYKFDEEEKEKKRREKKEKKQPLLPIISAFAIELSTRAIDCT